MSTSAPGPVRPGDNPVFTSHERLPDEPIERRLGRYLWWLLPALPAAAVVFWLLGGGLSEKRVQDYESACGDASQKRQWQPLEEYASAWTRLQPGVAAPWLYAAEAAKEQGDLARAAEYLRRAPDQDPRTPEALLELSDWLFTPLHRPLEGVETCERILRLNPRLGEAHRRLIFFYAMTLQRAKMARQIRQAIRYNCESVEAYVYLVGADWLTFSNAYKLNGDWLQAYPANELFLTARAINYIGTYGLEDGARPDAKDPNAAKHEQVLQSLDEYLLRFPKNLEVLVHFLRVNLLRGDAVRVADLLARAPPESAEDNRFWRFKGWIHAQQEEFAEAEAAYRRAFELDPYDWYSRHELCIVLRRLQRTAELEPLQLLAFEGKKLRKEILELPNARTVPKNLLARLAVYSRDCGDHEVADRMMRRAANMP